MGLNSGEYGGKNRRVILLSSQVPTFRVRLTVVGAFPNEGSVLRLLVPLAIDTNAKWLDRKYVSWENLEYSEVVDEKFTELF